MGETLSYPVKVPTMEEHRLMFGNCGQLVCVYHESRFEQFCNPSFFVQRNGMGFHFNYDSIG